jgi:hypothetical protein
VILQWLWRWCARSSPHLSLHLGLFIGQKKKKNKDKSEAKRDSLGWKTKEQNLFYFICLFFMATMDMVGILVGWRYVTMTHKVFEILTR